MPKRFVMGLTGARLNRMIVVVVMPRRDTVCQTTRRASDVILVIGTPNLLKALGCLLRRGTGMSTVRTAPTIWQVGNWSLVAPRGQMTRGRHFASPFKARYRGTSNWWAA